MVFNSIPSTHATATNYNVPYRSGNGPTIDGNISTAEWVGVTPVELTFQFNDTENPTIKVDLYLLHNGSALFIGLNMTTLDNQSDATDAFSIYFDEENNGDLCWLPENNSKEEGLTLLRDGNYTDLSYNDSEWIDDESIGESKGPGFGVTDGIGQWEFEFSSTYNPITWARYNSSDLDIDFPSQPVEYVLEIGFNIEYYDADLNKTDSSTTAFNQSERLDASVWDDLLFGRVPYAPLDETALWIYVTVAMFLPLGAIFYLLMWLLRKETE